MPNQPETNLNDITDIQRGGVIVIPWQTGMELGGGYDSITQVVKGNPKSSKLKLTLTPGIGKGSRDIAIQATKIETNEQLNDSLTTSVSINGSYGVFSGSSRTKFLRTSRINTYGLNFAISTLVSNAEQHLVDYKIDDSLITADAEDFRQRFGDYYVHGVITGGQSLGLISLDTTSSEAKEAISEDLKAGVDYGKDELNLGGRFSLEVANALKQKGASLRIRYDEVGGSGQAPQFTTVDGMLKAAISFPKTVQTSGGDDLFAILRPYAVLANPPGRPKQLDELVISEYRNQLAAVFLRTKNILDALSFALDNPSGFSGKKSDFERQKDEMNAILNRVEKAFEKLKVNPSQKPDIPELPSLDNIPPQLSSSGVARFSPPPVTADPAILLSALADAVEHPPKDSAIREQYFNFISEVGRDLSEQCRQAADIITTFIDFFPILDDQQNDRTGILTFILDEVDSASSLAKGRVLHQKADGSTFLSGDMLKKVTGILWDEGPDSFQYGLMGFWNHLSKFDQNGQRSGLLTNLQKAVSLVSGTKKISDVLQFPRAVWEQQKQLYRKAIREIPKLETKIVLAKSSL